MAVLRDVDNDKKQGGRKCLLYIRYVNTGNREQQGTNQNDLIIRSAYVLKDYFGNLGSNRSVYVRTY